MRILRLSKLTTVRQGLSSGGDYACFVPEPGQNIHLPLSNTKQANSKWLGFLVNVPFCFALN
jgi:hypothetical protein